MFVPDTKSALFLSLHSETRPLFSFRVYFSNWSDFLSQIEMKSNDIPKKIPYFFMCVVHFVDEYPRTKIQLKHLHSVSITNSIEKFNTLPITESIYYCTIRLLFYCSFVYLFVLNFFFSQPSAFFFWFLLILWTNVH